MSHHQKPARLRRTPEERALLRETRLHPDDFVMPIFFKLGRGTEIVESMPGILKMGEDAMLRKVEELDALGVKAILLFGEAKKKDAMGSASYDETSSFHQGIRKIKGMSDIVVIADVCLCAYTDHGHCGILKSETAVGRKQKAAGKERKRSSCLSSQTSVSIDHEKASETLAKIAVSYATVGVDVVAPSAMIDGQVKAIRQGLDKSGFGETAIMSYSAKYASSFYGPFRDITGAHPSFGDRKTYQMDPANKREAVRETLLDIEEGADMVMVKPALCFLDVISAIREKVNVPVAADNVSGEYSMVKTAAQKGWLDERSAAIEILTSIKRAGADIIISYWADQAVKWLKNEVRKKLNSGH